MLVHEKLLKPVMEARYLTVENADRYRSVIRLFYLNYEKLKYWMYQEEVYEELREDPYFASYTPDQCQQDLTALTSWGNLLTLQDTRKVASIEEFKNKKFRYQLSDAAVEIERMVLRLENLQLEGSSLEPTLLERLRASLARLEEVLGQSREEIYGWWKDVNSDFIRLNQNYQDYMRELNSVKAEEMMKTRAFLVFKDRLIEYLRSFVRSLQMNVSAIEQILRAVPGEAADRLLGEVTEYELSIPRLEGEPDRDLLYERMQGRWKSIREWFAGGEGQESEAGKVFDTTNEIIRKITRYAARISEQSNTGANRREEYYKLATMFSKCKDIYEAHRLSACVFGIEKPLHLKGEIVRQTESINSGVFEEKPCLVKVAPRVRTYKEKAERLGIRDRSKEKEATRLETIRRLEEQQKLLNQYIRGGRLEFRELEGLTPEIRDIFLSWLSKALENQQFQGKTEDGRGFYVENPNQQETCDLTCLDGVFRMPAYTLVFDRQDG